MDEFYCPGEYYSAVKKEWILIHATTWVNFKIIVLNERTDTKESTRWIIPFIQRSKKCKVRYNCRRQNKRGLGWDGCREEQREALQRDRRKVLKMIDYEQFLNRSNGFTGIHMSKHKIVHFKNVELILCQRDLNITV